MLRPAWARQRKVLVSLGVGSRYAEVVGGRLGLRTGRRETLGELAEELALSRARVEQIERKSLARLGRRPVALELELSEPEVLVRVRVAELRRARSWSARNALLRELGLDHRAREIIARRLALRGGKAASHRAIGVDAGLRPERVRRIEVGALEVLLRAAETLRDRDPALLALVRSGWARGGRGYTAVR